MQKKKRLVLYQTIKKSSFVLSFERVIMDTKVITFILGVRPRA